MISAICHLVTEIFHFGMFMEARLGLASLIRPPIDYPPTLARRGVWSALAPA
jgi:hypothetical protein